MLDYLTAREAADKWGITVRRVQILCAEGRIQGVVKRATVWFIPVDVEKPADGRAARKNKKIENLQDL